MTSLRSAAASPRGRAVRIEVTVSQRAPRPCRQGPEVPDHAARDPTGREGRPGSGRISDRTLPAVLREALSDVARHAHACAVTVFVRADGDLLLEVTDNGRGLDPAGTRSSGPTNLRRRIPLTGTDPEHTP
ncbi:hypothetical protein ACIRQQ_39855 [Streptomyces fuscichromogenes]|uniref:hypothetical protein n=1 Tax=Streptomyces fuscichromogenes TaxID=1324013 RepID=UPI003818A275